MTFCDEMTVERARQVVKWGEPAQEKEWYHWATVLGEEFGEVAKAINEHDLLGLQDELVQVATLCKSMYEQAEKEIMGAT